MCSAWSMKLIPESDRENFSRLDSYWQENCSCLVHWMISLHITSLCCHACCRVTTGFHSELQQIRWSGKTYVKWQKWVTWRVILGACWENCTKSMNSLRYTFVSFKYYEMKYPYLSSESLKFVTENIICLDLLSLGFWVKYILNHLGCTQECDKCMQVKVVHHVTDVHAQDIFSCLPANFEQHVANSHWCSLIVDAPVQSKREKKLSSNCGFASPLKQKLCIGGFPVHNCLLWKDRL